jgi:hypothetical protein
MAAESSLGNNWSDAYVGGFPHFGIGLVLNDGKLGLAFTARLQF